jgi:hypothetical protein
MTARASLALVVVASLFESSSRPSSVARATTRARVVRVVRAARVVRARHVSRRRVRRKPLRFRH